MTMRKLFFFFLLFSNQIFGQNLITRFEQSKGKESPTYSEIIAWWQKMDEQSPVVKMQAMGMSDAGFPLHLIIVSADKDFNFESLHKKNKRIILINNGIHPGEPDGIDASMLLVRDIAINKYKLPANIALAIIPVYNIGGFFERSKPSTFHYKWSPEICVRGNVHE